MSWFTQQNEEILRTERDPFDDEPEPEECGTCEGTGTVYVCEVCEKLDDDCECDDDSLGWISGRCPYCDGTGCE